MKEVVLLKQLRCICEDSSQHEILKYYRIRDLIGKHYGLNIKSSPRELRGKHREPPTGGVNIEDINEYRSRVYYNKKTL